MAAEATSCLHCGHWPAGHRPSRLAVGLRHFHCAAPNQRGVFHLPVRLGGNVRRPLKTIGPPGASGARPCAGTVLARLFPRNATAGTPCLVSGRPTIACHFHCPAPNQRGVFHLPVRQCPVATENNWPATRQSGAHPCGRRAVGLRARLARRSHATPPTVRSAVTVR
jgi:hypothetical protein